MDWEGQVDGWRRVDEEEVPDTPGNEETRPAGAEGPEEAGGGGQEQVLTRERRGCELTFSGGCGGGRGGATWDSGGGRGDAAPASSIPYGQDPTSGVGDARKGKKICPICVTRSCNHAHALFLKLHTGPV